MAKKLYRFINSKSQNKFLNNYCECCNIQRAAEKSGITRQTHYLWLKEDRYRMAFAKAKEMAVDVLEDEAVRRAVLGDERDIYYKGKKVGTVKNYSDRLLALLLKANKPDKYKDRVENQVVDGSEIVIGWKGENDNDAADRDTLHTG